MTPRAEILPLVYNNILLLQSNWMKYQFKMSWKHFGWWLFNVCMSWRSAIHLLWRLKFLLSYFWEFDAMFGKRAAVRLRLRADRSHFHWLCVSSVFTQSQRWLYHYSILRREDLHWFGLRHRNTCAQSDRIQTAGFIVQSQDLCFMYSY